MATIAPSTPSQLPNPIALEIPDPLAIDSILTAPLEYTLPLNMFFYICMALRRPKKTPLKVKFALSFATLLNQIFRSWKALVESQTYHQLPIPENYDQSSKLYHQRWLRGSPESIRIKAHFLNHPTPFSFCIDFHRRWARKILSNFFEILFTALILSRTWATFIVLVPSAFLASRADAELDAERGIVWRSAFFFAHTGTKNQTLTRMAIIAWGAWYIRIANSSDNRKTAAHAQKVGKDTQTAVENLTKPIMQKAATQS